MLSVVGFPLVMSAALCGNPNLGKDTKLCRYFFCSGILFRRKSVVSAICVIGAAVLVRYVFIV